MEMLIEILKYDPAETFKGFVYGTPIIGPIIGAICIFLALFFLFLAIHEMTMQSMIQERNERSKDEEKIQ